jgi:hypothetical protein
MMSGGGGLDGVQDIIKRERTFNTKEKMECHGKSGQKMR